jgi:glycosyltransferase involved in cell wall biosynthesis
MEAADIRAIWPTASIEVVEDQTDLPVDPVLPERGRDGAPLSVVFISRISPKKNLLLALEGLALCNARVDFSIYGPIEDEAYWSRCRKAIDRLPRSVQVSYRGTLDPEQVRATFAEHDLFIFPTMGENFGHVIAESLSASCAVLCSDQTPWTPVLAAGGGVALHAPTATSVAEIVREIADLTPEHRHAMRIRAGEAYRMWRRQTSDENILDRMSAR